MKLLLVAPHRHELAAAARRAGHDVVHATGAITAHVLLGEGEIRPDAIVAVTRSDMEFLSRRAPRGIPVVLVVALGDLGRALEDGLAAGAPS